jgi:hypothetical protein
MTNRQYLCDQTFNANRRNEHGALGKASKLDTSDIPVHTRWVVYSSSVTQDNMKIIDKYFIGLFCIFQVYVDEKNWDRIDELPPYC